MHRPPRPDLALWTPEARALVQRRYEANTPMNTILAELQPLMPGVSMNTLDNEINRQGYRRSAPQWVSPQQRDERLFEKAWDRWATGGKVRDRVRVVAPKSFPASGFSMLRGRV